MWSDFISRCWWYKHTHTHTHTHRHTHTDTHTQCVNIDTQPKGTFSCITISITQLHTCTSICWIPVLHVLPPWTLEGYVCRCNSMVLCLRLFILIPIAGEAVTSYTTIVIWRAFLKIEFFFIFQRLCYLELWNTPSSSAATVKIKTCQLISGLHLPVLWESLPTLWGQENTQQFELLHSQVVMAE